MKKILVVLLILAVAGGVFAQEGSWSIGSLVEIGTRVDLDPVPDVDDDDPALVDGIAYNNYDGIIGKLNIGYTKGDITVGLAFSTKGDTGIDVAFDGDNFKGVFGVSGLLPLVGNYGYDRDRNPWDKPYGDIGRLWGEFKFLNGVVSLLAAAAGPDDHYWVSDLSGVYGGTMDYKTDWKAAGNPFWSGDTFTKVDHDNYLLASLDLGAFNAGVMVPNLFFPNNGPWASWNKVTGNSGSTKFIDDSVRHTKLGLSFAQSPLEVAAQFYFEKYGIYFGGKFFTGPITLGLSFQGELDGDGKPLGDAPNDADPKHMRFGGAVDYDSGAFGGGIKAFYDRAESVTDGVKDEFYTTTIGIQPAFFYNVIPTHLQFRLDAGIYFLNSTNGTESSKDTVWGLQPQLFWNFKGTGAGGNYYWPLDTAIFMRYRMASADVRDTYGVNGSVNFLDVIFKWSF